MSEPAEAWRPVALAWLEPSAGERRYVESETRIGRGEHNNVRLDDPSVSRSHAVIRRVDGRYVISDLGSANKTFVNGERVDAPRALGPGDRIRVANTEFTFHLSALADPGQALEQKYPDLTARLSACPSPFDTEGTPSSR